MNKIRCILSWIAYRIGEACLWVGEITDGDEIPSGFSDLWCRVWYGAYHRFMWWSSDMQMNDGPWHSPEK